MEDDRELVRRASSDPEAFGQLYDKYFHRILNYVYRRTGGGAHSRDITSEVFLKAYTNLWRFRWKQVPFGAWLYRIATNEVNMFYRKKRYKAVSLEALREATGFDPHTDEHYLKERIAEEEKQNRYGDFYRVREIILELPLNYQSVLCLRYFEQLTIKEISQVLGKREGTVKSLLSRGLNMIRQRF